METNLNRPACVYVLMARDVLLKENPLANKRQGSGIFLATMLT